MECAAPPAAGADSPVAGTFYNTATGAFVTCDATCATCTGGAATNCKTCKAITAPATAPTEKDANFKTYLKTVALINNTCFKDCPTGFKADDAKATCVADSGSNSVLLSAFALIMSLFLIF